MKRKRKVSVWVGPPGKAVRLVEKEVFGEATVLDVVRDLSSISYQSRGRYHLDLLSVGPLERKKDEVFVYLLRWFRDGKLKEIKNINPASLIVPFWDVDLYILLEPLFLYQD